MSMDWGTKSFKVQEKQESSFPECHIEIKAIFLTAFPVPQFLFLPQHKMS